MIIRKSAILMKAYLIALFVLASAMLVQAADLKSQLMGYWVPDIEKTLEMARQEKREIDFMTQKALPKMTFEFREGKMIIHGPGRNKAVNPPRLYAVKDEDESSNTLILGWAEGKSDSTATLIGDQLRLKRQRSTIVFNRLSKAAFASRHVSPAPKVEDVTDKPIPDTPAEGKVHGVGFAVEKASLQTGILTLRQGEDFFAEQEFKITTFGAADSKLDEKKFLVKPSGGMGGPTVSMSYMVEGSKLPKSESFFKGYSMKLEFGVAANGKIPAKIHLRLPDQAESFVIGTFEADLK